MTNVGIGQQHGVKQVLACFAMSGMLVGTSPLERPTPAFPNKITSRSNASGIGDCGVPVIKGAGEVLEKYNWETSGFSKSAIRVCLQLGVDELG